MEPHILGKIEDSWNNLARGVTAIAEQEVVPADSNVDVVGLDVVAVELLVADATAVADYL